MGVFNAPIPDVLSVKRKNPIKPFLVREDDPVTGNVVIKNPCAVSYETLIALETDDT